MANDDNYKDLKTAPAISRVGGPAACQSMCMEIAERFELMSKAARNLGSKESALAFDCAFSAIAIVPYIIEKGLEIEFIRRMAEMTVDLVSKIASEDEFSPEEMKEIQSRLTSIKDIIEDPEPKIIH
jgi:hypothetical protein